MPMNEYGSLKENLSPVAFRLIFIGLSILSILPFWIFRYPVLADYPQHLARWFVLHNIHDPPFSFSGYYTLDWGPHPYVLVDALGALLQFVFPIDIAGRCVLSVCVLSVPLAALYFLRKAAPGNDGFALFAFLIAFNPMMLMGFVESQLSLALCVLAVGLWVSFCDTPKVLTGLATGAVIVLVYLAHLIGFALAGIIMGLYCVVLHKPLARLLRLGLLSLPGLALFVYNMKRSLAGGALTYKGPSAWDKLRNIVSPFRVYSPYEDLMIIAGLALFLFLLYRNRNQIRWQPSWLAVCAMLFAVYLAAPSQYGAAGYIDVRIVPLLYLVALATIRTRNMSWTLNAAIVLLVLFRVATIDFLFASKQHGLEERTAGFQAIPFGARVFPLVQLGSEKTIVGKAEIHHVAYGVIQKGFLVPTICYLPGFQPLRTTGAGYCPNPFCEVVSLENTDWGQVAKYYDYLWVDAFPAAIPYAESIAERVPFNGTVAIYRVRQPLPANSR
jgi:hypothetical protein